ncbi:syncollin-like [Engraulis encrasicolus]|uniref:syncollin-like n=1 Tax=Engraulis encrasicolus TaxID=184585 RepID=UPI002FCF7322
MTTYTMRTLAAALLCLVLCWDQLNAQCPDPATLKGPDGGKVCARMFKDSHYIYAQSCGGDSFDVAPGADIPSMPYSWNNRVSSLVVARFCSLSVWSRAKKEGKRWKFGAGVQYRLKEVPMGFFGNWDDEISSYYCEC